MSVLFMAMALVVVTVLILFLFPLGLMEGGMGIFQMVVAIVAISVFGGILREFVKSRKEISNAAQKDLAEINRRIAQIEADIADIKEQIADFIIKQI